MWRPPEHGDPYVAVVGSGDADPALAALAEEVGRGLGAAGAVLVCGGRGGVMAAACRGAMGAGGRTLGLLPGADRSEANPWVSMAVATGLGEARNALVVGSADAVIAVGGGSGTLSEIALALKTGRPVVGLRTWGLVRPDGTVDDRIERADGPGDAVVRALATAAVPVRRPG